MNEDLDITRCLKSNGYYNIDIEQIFNYLETLEFDIKNTKYIGQIVSKNERLAKYFFLRDQLKMDIDSLDVSFHIHEILDQCIDWSEFWRLLVIKKGFCCISLSSELINRRRFIFLAGPNLISRASEDKADSIYYH